MRKALLALVVVVAIFASVLVVRTARFASRQVPVSPAGNIAVDSAKVADHLSAALQFQTVSYDDPAKRDREAFLGLARHLEATYPKVHSTLTREAVADYSLLYTWKGREPAQKPLLLMAHEDVVPVEPGTESRWTYPPFSGRVAEGYVWGRGAMDDKYSLVTIFEAVEKLLQEGFQPRRTIYLAFGHDEEAGGQAGAAAVAALLESRGVKLEYVLDEGGASIRGMVENIAEPVAMVGIAEKGYVSVGLTVESPGGHSSMPPPETAVGILSAALVRLEQHPMPARIGGPVREMFDYLGPEMPFLPKMFCANLDLLAPLAKRRLAAAPATNALIRTTTAPTMLEGSVKDNVLPITARAVVNFRILPGDTVEGVLDHVRRTVDDPRVKVAKFGSFSSEPSAVSNTDSPSFRLLEQTIRQVFPGTVVAPTLVIGGTDSRNYAKLTENTYRFGPVTITPPDLARVHGTNERISEENLAGAVKFYVLLIRNSNP